MFNNTIIIISIILILYIIIIQYRYKAYFVPHNLILSDPSEYDKNIKWKEININGLNGWFFPNSNLNPNTNLTKPNLTKPNLTKPNLTNPNIMIYFHGNAGNISNRIEIIKELLEIFSETDIYIFDYPGFGLSKGDLNINNIILKSYKVYDYWANHSNSYKNIILYGESIGAGIMAEVYDLIIKMKHPIKPKMLIHMNGLPNMRKVVSNIIPNIIKPFILPWITEFDVENIYYSHKKNLPKLLLIHAPKDELIPINLVYEMAKRLNLKIIKIDGGHNNPILDDNVKNKISDIYNSLIKS